MFDNILAKDIKHKVTTSESVSMLPPDGSNRGNKKKLSTTLTRRSKRNSNPIRMYLRYFSVFLISFLLNSSRLCSAAQKDFLINRARTSLVCSFFRVIWGNVWPRFSTFSPAFGSICREMWLNYWQSDLNWHWREWIFKDLLVLLNLIKISYWFDGHNTFLFWRKF